MDIKKEKIKHYNIGYNTGKKTGDYLIFTVFSLGLFIGIIITGLILKHDLYEFFR